MFSSAYSVPSTTESIHFKYSLFSLDVLKKCIFRKTNDSIAIYAILINNKRIEKILELWITLCLVGILKVRPVAQCAVRHFMCGVTLIMVIFGSLVIYPR